LSQVRFSKPLLTAAFLFFFDFFPPGQRWFEDDGIVAAFSPPPPPSCCNIVSIQILKTKCFFSSIPLLFLGQNPLTFRSMPVSTSYRIPPRLTLTKGFPRPRLELPHLPPRSPAGFRKWSGQPPPPFAKHLRSFESFFS